jgi:hypothetical protein
MLRTTLGLCVLRTTVLCRDDSSRAKPIGVGGCSPGVRRTCPGETGVGLTSPTVTSTQGSRTGGPQLLPPSLVLLLVTFVCMAGLLVALVWGQARGRWLIPTIAVLFVAWVSAIVVGLLRRRDDARDRHQSAATHRGSPQSHP